MSRITGDLIISGNLSVGGNLAIPAGSVNNSQVGANAALDVAKLKHLYKADTNFGLPVGGTPATYEEHVFTASGTGEIRSFNALLTDTGTSTNIDFDIKVNGTTVLAGVVNFTHADADGTVKQGTLSSVALAADDRVSISMAVTSATGALGPRAWVEIEEGAN